MTSKTIAMSLGMSVSLLVGYILGVIFNDDLFVSTVLGIITGMFIGIAAGVRTGTITVLEGVFAGIMGGMMGAMLGNMITPEDRDFLLKILFFICFSTLLVMWMVLENEINNNKSLFFTNPLVTIIMYGIIFLLINQFDPYLPVPASNEQEITTPPINEKDVYIQADEFKFSPQEQTINAGDQVELTLLNTGTIEHDLEIINLSTETVNTNHEHDHSNSSQNVHVHAAPGEEQRVTFIPSESGTYMFVCTLPGHQESGMVGTLEVL
ncbi:plastocyanin/azurin family copper-binding protein [Halobacillus massiliensis]|uniref:plastocyanin/azurin family copper-binding protein n=1 Tax=Halobacillus massiliensis TaxID=1926286 RepID=UPI00117B4CF9|nr:plastocyanin/azurin family copper-binding protein [Halobacillus massiliensis]